MGRNRTYLLLILLATAVMIAGCTSHSSNTAGEGSSAVQANNSVKNIITGKANAASNNTVQQSAPVAKKTIPSVATGRIFSSSLKKVQSANMYEGNINFVLDNGQMFTINNVCIAADTFNIGQCFRINIANIDKVRGQMNTSAMLNGCYIPDFSSNTIQKVSCPSSLQ